jgi:hypothetical protein
MALNGEQRTSFLRRLDELSMLGMELRSKKRWHESESFESFIENLELDISLRQEYDMGPAGGLTRWLTHYSWVFNSCPAKLRKSIPKSALASLDQGEPSGDAALDEYKLWFEKAGNDLVSALEGFSTAVGFDGALAFLFLVDVLFSRMLTVCYKLRFHPSLVD